MSRATGTLSIVIMTSLYFSLAIAAREPSAAQSSRGKKITGTPHEIVLVKPLGYKPDSPTPASALGAKLYSESHCSACHSIGNAGASIGPVLDAIGARRNVGFLIARLGDTPADIAEYAKLAGQDPSKLGGHLRLSENIARSIASYLMTLPEPVGGYAVSRHRDDVAEKPLVKPEFRPEEKSVSSENGKKLYDKFSCARCHQIQQIGGFIGPSLDGIGKFHSREFIAGQVTDAQAEALTTDKFFESYPTAMPRFTASPVEAKQVADYLMTLPPRE